MNKETKRPYTICHMITSLDGRIDCGMLENLAEYETYCKAIEALNAPTTVTGSGTIVRWKSHSTLPGTTKLSHLEENLRATEIVFSGDEMRELEDAVAAIPVVGSRYDALQESKVQK